MAIRRFRLSVLAAAAALSAAGAFAQTDKLLPIQVPTEEVLAQYPKMTGFRLSPDGKRMLAIESNGDVRNILIWETDNLAAKPKVIGSSAMRIRGASFLKNDMLSVSLWQPYDSRLGTLTKTFINKLLVTDLDGKVWKEPLEAVGSGRSEIAQKVNALAVPTIKSRLPKDPDNVIVESDTFGSERDLFRYNVRTGEAARVMRLAENDIEVSVDARGNPRYKARGGSDSKGVFIATDIRNANGGWDEHFRTYMKEREAIDIVSTGTDGKTLVLRSNQGRDVAGLYEYDVEQRKIKSTLFEHKYFEATGVRVHGDRDAEDAGSFDGFTYAGIYGDEVHWVNPKFEAVIKGIAQSLRLPEINQTLVDVKTGQRNEVKMIDGASVTIVDYRDGETPTYLLRVSGLTYPTEYYLLRGQRLSLLAKEQPAIDRRALGQAKFVYYQARDGLNIPAYLTVPNKELCGPGPYAAVIHPHGGPWSRDDMVYDYSGWVPMMVSRCQVVLQPQYRGSLGWGRTLWLAGDGEWGQKMQDDKDDGAKWLVSEKLADPKRIAMFGFSYGGYAAFAAAVRPNDLYKCAIAGAGVSDIDKIWADFYTNPYFRDRQAPTVKGLSPARVADKIKIPIMVYHGDRDQIVPLVQSDMFVDPARKSGQPVDYHVVKDYAHGPAWTVDTMTQQLKLITQYFSKGCGGSGL